MSKFEKRPGHVWLLAHIGHIGDECLIWPYSCCTPGYGLFMTEKKRCLAHREMCRLTHGEPPAPGYQAAHSCGNRRCVNPNHLSWKSPGENQLDRRIHGTHAVKRTKLNARQAAQIRQLKGTETSIETAAKYGITESNVRLIQDGKTWPTSGRKYRISISDDEVRAIRRIGYSRSDSQIAAELGVTIGTIGRVRRGVSYRHVV